MMSSFDIDEIASVSLKPRRIPMFRICIMWMLSWQEHEGVVDHRKVVGNQEHEIVGYQKRLLDFCTRLGRSEFNGWNFEPSQVFSNEKSRI